MRTTSTGFSGVSEPCLSEPVHLLNPSDRLAVRRRAWHDTITFMKVKAIARVHRPAATIPHEEPPTNMIGVRSKEKPPHMRRAVHKFRIPNWGTLFPRVVPLDSQHIQNGWTDIDMRGHPRQI